MAAGEPFDVVLTDVSYDQTQGPKNKSRLGSKPGGRQRAAS
jgi:hypothetical protein